MNNMKTTFNILGTLCTIGMIVSLPIAGFCLHPALGWLLVAISCFVSGKSFFDCAEPKKKDDTELTETKP